MTLQLGFTITTVPCKSHLILLETHLTLYRSPGYSCTCVFQQVLRFSILPIVKQCPVKSANLDFRSTQNTMYRGFKVGRYPVLLPAGDRV